MPCSATVTGASLSLTPTPSYANNTNVGTAGASATYAGDANHIGSTGTGSFTIARAASAVTVTCTAGAPYTYTGSAQTPCTAAASGAGDPNHLGSTGTGSFAIGPAILTVMADNKTMVLNGSLPALTGTLTGVKNGDGITASYSTSANGTNVGVFPIVPSLYDPNAKLGNYTVAPTNGNLTVQYAQGGICLASSGHQILQPVNADGSSVFKKGSTIPVKFRVCDANANPIGGAGQVVTVWNQNWPVLYWKSSGAGAIDEEILSTTPDTQFRWDDTAQQWVFNLNSKNLTAGMIYTYRIYLNDASNIEFKFGVK